jgi:FtsH-binding integral membrane protein
MEYIVDIINTTTFIVCLASIVANFTPSTKDDVFISKIGNLIQLLALNFNIKR